VASLLKGVDCAGPRDSIKTAYALRLIENQTLWLEILEDKKKTHRNDAGYVNRLSGTIQNDYLPFFQKLLSTLNHFDGDSHLPTP